MNCNYINRFVLIALIVLPLSASIFSIGGLFSPIKDRLEFLLKTLSFKTETVDANGGSALANLASSMTPGEWRQLPVNGLSRTLFWVPGGRTLDFMTKGNYDPVSEEVRFIGHAHYADQRWHKYDENTNTWSNLNDPPWDDGGMNPPSFTGHGYHHNTIDPATGDDYYRMTGTTSTIRRRDNSNNTWGTIATPANPLGTVIGSLEWLPTIGSQGGLVFANGDRVQRWDKATNSWTTAGTFTDQGRLIHGVWVSKHNIVVFGGGIYEPRKMWKIGPTGGPIALPDAPDTFGGLTILGEDPVSGDVIVIRGSSRAYRLTGLGAGENASWVPITIPSGPPFPTLYDSNSTLTSEVVAISIRKYGVIMYLFGEVSEIWLYKPSASVSVSSPLPENGMCGTSNGSSFSSIPSSNLCSAGNASTVSTNTSTYSWSCLGINGGTNASCSATKTVVVPAPTVTLSASFLSITSGQSSTITWSSTDSTSCTASGGWSGSKATSGTQSVSPTSNTTYSLSCSGSGGSASKSIQITVESASNNNQTTSNSSEFPQYFTHDGDLVGGVQNSSAPTRLYWNTVLNFKWKRGDWGDWLDSRQVQFGMNINGAVPHASFAVPSPGTYTSDVTPLVTRWVNTGENKGFYLRMRGNAFPVRFAGRTDSDSSKRPTLIVTTTSGTYNLTARANATWDVSTFRVISTSNYWELSGTMPTILHFDLRGISGTVTSAVLQVTDISHRTGSTMTNGVVDIFEADPPRIVVPNNVANQEVGIANSLSSFQSLANHPNVFFSDDFATPGPFDAGWARPVERIYNPSSQTTYAQSLFTKGTNGSADNKILTMRGKNGHGGDGMDVIRDELYAQYYLYLDNDFGSSNDGIKIPAIGTQFGWWNINRGGYWHPVTGNGGSKGTGLKKFNATSNRFEYEGHSVRIVTSLRPADNSVYSNLHALYLYPYNLDQNGPFPDFESFPYLAIEKGKWYPIDLHMKLNSMSGTQDSNGNYAIANPDGVYKAWVNGYPAFSKSNFRWRKHPDFGVEGFWLDFYHGGVELAPYDMHYAIDRVTLANRYIGPQRINPLAPTVSLSISSASITQGQSVTISWNSTNSTSCIASGGWSGTKTLSGTQVVTPSMSTTYTLTCSGNYGTSIQNITVIVNTSQTALIPIISISASPSLVSYNNTSVIKWSSSNATNCSISGANVGTSGEITTPSLKTATSYVITCTGPGGSASNSVLVSVSPQSNVSAMVSTSTSNNTASIPESSEQNITNAQIQSNILVPGAQLTVDDRNSCVVITRDMGYLATDRQTNGEVSILQRYLGKEGYLNSEPTGFFGRLTRAAVRLFQTSNSIRTTGYVGPLTKSKILSLSCLSAYSSKNSDNVLSGRNSHVVFTNIPQTIDPNSSLSFSWSVLSSYQPKNKDWVGIVPKSYVWQTGDGVKYPWIYTGGTMSGTKLIKVPSQSGFYELVYFENDYSIEVARSAPFFVGTNNEITNQIVRTGSSIQSPFLRPTVTLEIQGDVKVNLPFLVKWTSINATKCSSPNNSISINGSSTGLPISGEVTITITSIPTEMKSFQISCSGLGGQTSRTLTVSASSL